MLAKTPKTAQEMGIDEIELEALLWVRNALALGQMQDRSKSGDLDLGYIWSPEQCWFQPRTSITGDVFSMTTACVIYPESFGSEKACGTVACIGGWMGLYIHGFDNPSQASRFVQQHGGQRTYANPRSPFKPLFWPMHETYHINRSRYETIPQAVAAIDRWLDGERDVHKLWPITEGA